jgi:hypothetical protein
MTTKFQRIDKDLFVTETILMLTKFGDYLVTVDSALENLKLSGLNNVMTTFGESGRLNSSEAKKFFTAHRKRFDRDMGRFCRYSAATILYSLLEVRLRAFVEDFGKTYPGKPAFKKYLAKPDSGFVGAFQLWLETPPFPVVFPQPRLWKQLQDFQSIRNCIVHSHGDLFLIKNPKRATDAVGRTRKASFNSDGTLVLEREFVFEVGERIYAFFQLLFGVTGYSISLPPGHAETLAKNFAGFEAEIAKKYKEYYAKQTINLGGQLG